MSGVIEAVQLGELKTRGATRKLVKKPPWKANPLQVIRGYWELERTSHLETLALKNVPLLQLQLIAALALHDVDFCFKPQRG